MSIYKYIIIILLWPRVSTAMVPHNVRDFDRSPELVLGDHEDTDLAGNGGEPYGAEFAKIIYVDVFQFLKDQFQQNKIPSSHPLYALKARMARFEALLQEQDRVSAVANIVDSTGHEVLARVVPSRSSMNIVAGATTIDQQAFDVEVDTSRSTSETLTLRPFDKKIISEVNIGFQSGGLSWVRLGAHPITADGVLLPAGVRFYAVCNVDEAMNLSRWRDSETVEILCGGFNLDGSIATMQGTLTKSSSDVSATLRGKLQIKLYLQKYGIQVNRSEFERLQKTSPKSTIDRLVFHEYLRLLGVDDNGNKLSMLLDGLRLNAFAQPKFPFVGAKVVVPVGAEYITMKDQQLIRHQQPQRTQRARICEISEMYDVQFTLRGVFPARVLRVQCPEAAGFLSVHYHFLTEVKSATNLEVSQ